MLCGLQFALTGAVELPEAGSMGGGVRTALPPIDLAGPDPALRLPTIFSPRRTAGGADSPSSPLGGTAIAGVIAVRGRSFAVVQHADGSVGRVPIGGRIAGLKLVALEADAAVLSGGGKPLRVAYGAAPVPEASPGENTEVEETQQ